MISEGAHVASDLIPFHTYILKVASRCNLNCTYCFVYNKADQKWRNQPGVMSRETAQTVCRRIRTHCESHGKKSISLVFHGGEPLLLGARRLRTLLEVIGNELVAGGIQVKIGMQSNGTLITDEICEVLLAHDVTIGISMDGPPHVNDLSRIDHHGVGSTASVEAGLQVLQQEKFRQLFTGFLCVVDLDVAPEEVLDYLSSFGPRGIDFLLPYDNWDFRPKGKLSFKGKPYGEWLVRAFEHWRRKHHKVRIREFESIIATLTGSSSRVESLGLDPVDIVVIETNGDIEAVDSLKATYDGATALGLNVNQNDFDEAATHIAVRQRQAGANSLARVCQECELVNFCGGGYIPNRYSRLRGFDNPSIYCHDLAFTIRHIHGALVKELGIEQ